jgi:uncharacterized membrane protein
MIVATLQDWLLLGHIVGAMVWLGGVTLLTALATRALRSGPGAAQVEFVRSLRGVGPVVLAPAPLLMIVCGVWLAIDTDAFDQLWVQLALGLFIVAFGVGAARQSRVGIAAERAAEQGDHAALAGHLGRWAWGMGLIILLLMVATWDMVFKPGL